MREIVVETPYFLRIVIEDEAGKVDLNRAPDQLLVDLFVAVGVGDQRASELVDAIVDFRDRDNLRRLNGAEDGDYERAGLPYGAKDAPFEAIEELQRVLGMTRALYRAVAPSITVHNRRRTRGLRALLNEPPLEDMDPAEIIRRARRDRANRPTVGAPVAGAPAPGAASGRFPSAVTIRAQARAASGAIFVREAIVSLAPNGSRPFRIVKWTRGARFAGAGEPGPDDAPDQPQR
ncbi:MAG: general secretion pathway protein GspK [Proteobacteria bacterium]|nr:general secretion pathway protein GspK [Pseudomonadota bacterium]